jgi:hypothetical protein
MKNLLLVVLVCVVVSCVPNSKIKHFVYTNITRAIGNNMTVTEMNFYQVKSVKNLSTSLYEIIDMDDNKNIIEYSVSTRVKIYNFKLNTEDILNISIEGNWYSNIVIK